MRRLGPAGHCRCQRATRSGGCYASRIDRGACCGGATVTLSGDNIRDIAIAVIGALQTIGVTIIVRRTKRIRDKVDVVDTKVSGVASAVNTVHALVDSRHSELQGELKKA